MTRSELYRLVWTLPVRQLAPLFGMSDTGLQKLCRRYDIPTPNRGYWMRIATGQKIAPTQLPPRAADETIPRLRAIDGQGNAAEIEGEMIIPGLIARPLAPPIDAEGLRAALERAGAPRPEPHRQTHVAVPPAPPERPTAKPSPSATEPRRSDTSSGLGIAALAMDADIERLAAAAIEMQRHEALLQFLGCVVMRVLDEDPEEARPILEWAARVRHGLGTPDPVARTIASLRHNAAAGRLCR